MKVNFTSIGCVPAADLERNKAYARRRGFPKWGPAAVQHLAVVGGGPSIKDRRDEIASFDGDVWAINGAFQWCREHGIDATFFTIDPLPETARHMAGAERAIVSVQCDRSVLDALPVASFEAFEPMHAGATTATAAPMLAIEKGYRSVTFFGCESSFGSETHAYGNRDLKNLVRVRCNRKKFLTTPDMIMQAEFLGELIRTAPCFKQRSGGLLEAVVANPEIDVIAASRQLHKALT